MWEIKRENQTSLSSSTRSMWEFQPWNSKNKAWIGRETYRFFYSPTQTNKIREESRILDGFWGVWRENMREKVRRRRNPGSVGSFKWSHELYSGNYTGGMCSSGRIVVATSRIRVTFRQIPTIRAQLYGCTKKVPPYSWSVNLLYTLEEIWWRHRYLYI